MNDRLRHILGVALEMPAQQIHDKLTAEETSNWDSIRHLNLVMELEEKFNVRFSSDEMIRLNSYQAIADALAARGIA